MRTLLLLWIVVFLLNISIPNNKAIAMQSCALVDRELPEIEAKFIRNVITASESDKLTMQLKNNLSCEITLYSSSGKQIIKDKKGVKISSDIQIVSGAYLMHLLHQVIKPQAPKVYKDNTALHTVYGLRLRPNNTVYFTILKKDLPLGGAIAVPYSTAEMRYATPALANTVKVAYLLRDQ